MIGPASFLLPGGRQVAPLHVAPWFDDPEVLAQGGLIAGLRGGMALRALRLPDAPPRTFPPDWRRRDGGRGESRGRSMAMVPTSTGPSSMAIRARSPLAVDYPEGEAVRRLERQVRPDPEAAALDLSLTIHARPRDARAGCPSCLLPPA